MMNTDEKAIVYVTDVFLQDYKAQFMTKYLPLYQNNDIDALSEIFDINDSKIILSTDNEFTFKSLKLDDEYKLNNVINLYEGLKHITTSMAENEKLWVGLSNTHYLDYHVFKLNQAQNTRGLRSRAYHTHGTKRSLSVNNLSLIWWIGYYSIDNENDEDKYHLTRFLVENANRGDLIGLFSSNHISSKNVRLGIIEGIKELYERYKISINRYTYTESNKILNQIGGTRILDALPREEIREIIVDNLVFSDRVIVK